MFEDELVSTNLFFILGTPKQVPITKVAPKIPDIKGKTTFLPKELEPTFLDCVKKM